ncbi:hypothetical protein GVY41_00820 [Frigidibacter albus]|uniref:Uncharacterized protein n=1 Tax=Frigidibacter albus TaxID=1465486 RepID=A0A6L8VBI9_9RHOB|nr:hypothetical protein [Frigidibacter albus]MZQ87633.1 hypothetical protein [Frigidibacter albus]NBE29539.1 hypothetical protein [Frigidibacter albus]
MGESGCGKSTLARMRGVFIKPQSDWPSVDRAQGRARRYAAAEVLQARYFLEGWAAQLAVAGIDQA